MLKCLARRNCALRSLFGLTLLMTMLSTNGYGVLAQSLNLNWSEDGGRFWYVSSDQAGSKDFYIVDVAKRSRKTAFEPDRVAKLLADKLDLKVESSRLPIDTMILTDQADERILIVKGDAWLLDLATYEISPVDDAASLALKSRFFLPIRPSRSGGDSIEFTLENRLDQSVQLFWIDTRGIEQSYGSIEPAAARTQHTYEEHIWLLKSAEGEPLGCFAARAGDQIVIDQSAIDNVRRESRRGGGRSDGRRGGSRRWNSRADRDRRFASPDGKWTVFVRDYDLWLRSGDDEILLSGDGSEGNSFGSRGGDSPDVHWSPDSKFLVARQTTVVPERTVYYIESSPDGQLQPKLQSYEYRKPGDELPKPTMHLFSIPDMRAVPVSHELFSNPWSLRFQGWSEESDRFELVYNERGHQTIRVLEVLAADGSVRTIIEETSPTFIQYSDAGKSVHEDLSDDEILWASERSGWNHLYRYSRTTGEVLNAVTAGLWNVKRIVKIDRDAERIWFMAVGVHSDQDPYHEHFCRVNFNGSGFAVLTAGDGTHRVSFEREGAYFLDTYSRVDLAPITELRESQTGELICELERGDAADRFAGRRLTERFVAKGRDGQTDIWGIIHWPRDFDPEKTYPVVENIYAGPHDHHVPKSFRSRYGHQHRIADAGVIVVQIDGMGTAWRSKAFHDVCYKNLHRRGLS